VYVSLEEFPHLTVISVNGVLDRTQAPILNRVIEDHRSRQRLNLLLDLEHASHVDASEIRFLTQCASSLKAEGGELTISGLRADQMELFDVARLLCFCHFYGSKRAALEAIELEGPANRIRSIP